MASNAAARPHQRVGDAAWTKMGKVVRLPSLFALLRSSLSLSASVLN